MYVSVTKIRKQFWAQGIIFAAIVRWIRWRRVAGMRFVDIRSDAGEIWIMEGWEERAAMLRFRSSPDHRKHAVMFRRWLRGAERVQLETEEKPSWPDVVTALGGVRSCVEERPLFYPGDR